MFFYGTLKRGHPAHRRLCRGALRVEQARVRGLLYELPQGYPALQVPKGDIRLAGTADPSRDAERQARLNRERVEFTGEPPVYGELCHFSEPERHLPALDAYEGFDPAGHSLYLRVLIPVLTAGGPLLAWTYVMSGRPPGAPIPDGRWPA